MSDIGGVLSDVGGFVGGVGGLLAGLAAVAAGCAVIVSKAVKLLKRRAHGFTKVLRALWKSRLTAAALAAVLVGALFLIARHYLPSPCSPVAVSITSPADGAVVSQSQPVLGTINHLCPGHHLWLVLQPGGLGGGGYYPQNEVAVASDAERWSVAAYFGRPSRSDDGRTYTLLAVAADDATNLRFQGYLRSGAITHKYLGLGDLGGAAVLSQIKVTRGSYPT